MQLKLLFLVTRTMKKLALLFTMFAAIAFGQNKYEAPVAPGCDEFEMTNERLKCFNEFNIKLIESYFKVRQNLDIYLRLIPISEKANFQINTEGKYVFKSKESNSVLFIKIANDVFDFINAYLEEQTRHIIPAKSPDGKPAVLNFNMPITFQLNEQLKSDVEKSPILFSTPDLIVRLGKDYTFKVYDQQGQLLRELNSVSDIYTDSELSHLTRAVKNTIVEKNVQGKTIKLEVEHVFQNQRKALKINYYENGILKKEIDSMDKFLKSEYSKYIY